MNGLLHRLLQILVVAAALLAVASGEDTICTSDTNTFTVKVNLYAGEMGTSPLFYLVGRVGVPLQQSNCLEKEGGKTPRIVHGPTF